MMVKNKTLLFFALFQMAFLVNAYSGDAESLNSLFSNYTREMVTFNKHGSRQWVKHISLTEEGCVLSRVKESSYTFPKLGRNTVVWKRREILLALNKVADSPKNLESTVQVTCASFNREPEYCTLEITCDLPDCITVPPEGTHHSVQKFGNLHSKVKAEHAATLLRNMVQACIGK